MPKSSVFSLHVYSSVSLSGVYARGEAANRGDGIEWQWNSRYCPCAEDHRPTITVSLVASRGIRDTARVLKISPTTVIENLKKSPQLKAVNEARLLELEPTQTLVRLCQWEDVEAELDEMWSFVGSKQHQHWLWHAVDHETGDVLAYVLAEHKDAVFLELKALLEPFGITQFYTDGWGAYERHIEPVFHTVGKVHTQMIERKHLTLRTRIKRLARKTICFSKSEWLHDVVIGLFINRFEFGLPI